MNEPAATILDYDTPRRRATVGRDTVHGTIRVFLAEALILPTGLITAAFLTRKLGQSDYGMFTLASILVAWVEWSITSVFTRAVIKFTAEADDWRPVGTTVVRLHLWVSCLAAAAIVLLAVPIAHVLHAPTIVPYLRLFAIDIPIFSLGQAHRNILIGLGGFGRRAVGGAARWVSRMIFIIVLIQLGLSINGAILGNIAASIIELAVYRYFTPAPLFAASAFPTSQLWGFAVPLFMASISLRLFEKLDLLMLTHFRSSLSDLAEAGVYGAAQNLSIIPGILAMSFSPLLLSTLTRVIRSGDMAHARDMARDSIRGAVLMFPAAGIVAGAAPEIVVLIFGPNFAAAATPLTWLMFGGLGLLVIAVTASVMIAGNKPGWTFAFCGPMVPLAAAGHYLLIPRFGSTGAAAVTALIACAAALASVAGVYQLWRTVPPPLTWLRTAGLTVGAYALSSAWPAPGAWVALKLTVAMIAVGLGFLALGEFDRREIALARSVIRSLFSAKAEGAE